MKKIFAVMLVVVLTLGVTACTKKVEAPSGPSTNVANPSDLSVESVSESVVESEPVAEQSILEELNFEENEKEAFGELGEIANFTVVLELNMQQVTIFNLLNMQFVESFGGEPLSEEDYEMAVEVIEMVIKNTAEWRDYSKAILADAPEDFISDVKDAIDWFTKYHDWVVKLDIPEYGDEFHTWQQKTSEAYQEFIKG